MTPTSGSVIIAMTPSELAALVAPSTGTWVWLSTPVGDGHTVTSYRLDDRRWLIVTETPAGLTDPLVLGTGCLPQATAEHARRVAAARA